ncbi:LysM peptidoglycan-binding domain-containing protein [Bacillus lacus]|uniref:LysM peptidoglycan-binding domain-containing protein n=1 Tax=Metabacillus lacus TaxID=1983721 RepID=A0A7X2IX04_9BACI|nr:LysM peptidoglycan-binding domain-containing protein [Metabacillus lacus]MRX70693.1 LysM peptidoglycan-binding domain-containing protein [Metabacillus lacus]
MKKETAVFSFMFIMLAISGVFALAYTGASENIDRYVEVEISEGDSLWKLSKKYEGEHRLSTVDFVAWVQSKNNLQSPAIKPGDKVFIPVEKSDIHQYLAGEEQGN